MTTATLVPGTSGAPNLLHHAGTTYQAAIGRGGVARHKQEGDGATPAGLLPLRRLLYRADRLPRPRSALPTQPIAPHDGWCDDPTDPRYNRPIPLPDPARHEELWRTDETYDLIAVLGWNDAPPRRNEGSAIFLHLARPTYTPTEGCIALSRPDLLTLLAAGLTQIEVTT